MNSSHTTYNSGTLSPRATNDDPVVQGQLTPPEKNNLVDQNEHSPNSTAIDLELEKRVLRKIDWHVPPLVTFLLYVQNMTEYYR